jgi:kumamolisin
LLQLICRGRQLSTIKPFPDSVIPILDRVGRGQDGGWLVEEAGAIELEAQMFLHFALAVSEAKKAQLEQTAHGGEPISPEILTSEFGSSSRNSERVIEFLRSYGLEISYVSADRANVYVTGIARQIATILNVTLVKVTTHEGSFIAAGDVPNLPLSIGQHVDAIIGLQPFLRARKGVQTEHTTSDAVGGPGAIGRPIPSPAGVTGYLVSQIKKAYAADLLGADGSGQTIAILIDTFPRDADLIGFWAANEQSANLARIQKINVKGGALPAPEGEETLDAEWASGIAAGAKVRVYATTSLNFPDLNLGLDRIIDDLAAIPGLKQVSISLGLGELFLGAPNGIIATQHAKYVRLAAAGINVFVSSGDGGATPDQTGKPGGPLHVQFPATDPCVIGVGGTTLMLQPNGAVSSEVAWSGSGGGVSKYLDRPAWQRGSDIPAGAYRLVPDVAAAADPTTGAFFYFESVAKSIGGTSWSAPTWAGFCACLNQLRIAKGLGPLPYLNPLFYGFRSRRRFRDIVSGSNGGFFAGPGYDMVTGLGTPLMNDLSRSLTAGTLRVTPTTNIEASGLAGGNFLPATFSYSLQATEGSIEFLITPPEWLSVQPTSGVATTAPTTVTFTVNERAKLYSPSIIGPMAIEFQNSTIGPTPSISATLTVRGANLVGVDPAPNMPQQLAWGGAPDVGVVVGYGYRVPDGRYTGAVVWKNRRPATLEYPPTPIETTTANGCDASGILIVGSGSNTRTRINQALRWRNGRVETLKPLQGHESAQAKKISANGKCTIGTSGPVDFERTAVRWMNDYIEPQSLGENASAEAVNPSGTIIVGQTEMGERSMPLQWTDRDGQPQREGLEVINGHFGAFALSVNSDGTVIVGFTQVDANKRKAVVWRNGKIAMLEPAAEAPGSTAEIVSESGAVIFGTRNIGGMFRWTSKNGIESVIDLLEAANVDVSRWYLERVTAISRDGSIISGIGHYTPPGQPQVFLPFVVEIPLPR